LTIEFEIALTLLSAFLVTTAMMPVAKAASVRFGIVAQPSIDRPHERPTAMLGGVAVMAGFIFAIGLVGVLSGLPHHSISWLAGFAVAMCVVGLLDDIVDLRPRNKLMLELAAICVLVWWGPQLDFFPYRAVNIALTVFWLVTATNAFNLIDGVDGLAAGVGIVAALSIATVAGLHQHIGTMIAALSIAGALAGFMVFNFPPASIFMGDQGALAVGLVLGVLSIQGSHFGAGSLPARLAMPLLALMVPLLDTVTVTVTRLATGNPISRRGLDHSHHRLTRLGMSSWSAAATLIGLQVIAGACAIALSLVPGYDAVLLIPFIALFFALVALFLMDRSFDADAPGQVEDLPPIARVILSFGYKRRFVELILDVALVAGAYFGAVLLRFDFNLDITQVTQMLAGLPWIVAIGCSAFFVTGVYRGIWRYTGLAEGVRFMLAALLAGLAVKLSSSFLPIYLGRSTAVMFVLLLFNFLVGTRWSFHLFQRIGRSLARSTRRLVIVGADARGAAAVQHLHSTTGGGAQLLGVVDEDNFKHGKLFHGYPVLGSLDDLDEIMARTPFDEIVIAQETLSPLQLAALESFAASHQITLRRFWLGVTDLSAPAISERELKTA
jgi:UDP-GlcNAc:undecaprenyl-phosphate/decaprenyl-phosphate GlcNAc-1-phosphate transferase